MVQKILEKKRPLQINKRKTKTKNTRRVATRRLHIEGQLTIERRAKGLSRLQRRKHHKFTKTKQNKTNVTPEKDVMASANQTPGGYNLAPLLVASQQGRANQPEPTCFGISSPWSFPASRSGMPLYAVVQPWLSLQRSISP